MTIEEKWKALWTYLNMGGAALALLPSGDKYDAALHDGWSEKAAAAARAFALEVLEETLREAEEWHNDITGDNVSALEFAALRARIEALGDAEGGVK